MSVNTETVIAKMYELRNKGVTYSMYGSRNGSDGTADCSGALSYCLMQAGATNPGYLPSTETMHAWLAKNGYSLIAHNKEWQMKRGDIIIFGEKGKSAGAGGHVVIAIDNNNVIHCNYGHNGVSVNPETTLPYSMGWYVYRQQGQVNNTSPTPTSKPTTQTGINWIPEKWHFVTNTPIYLRTAPSVKAPEITLLGSGSYIKYDAYCYKDGYVWLRQPRSNGTYGYLASGECVGNKRTNYWGSFD